MSAKLIDILGEAAPPVRAASGVANLALAQNTGYLNPDSVPVTTKDLLFTALGGLGGYLAFKKHPFLGAVGGMAVGSSIEPMMRNLGNDRTDAMYRIGIAGAGIAGSLYMKKQHPVVGYAVGALGASAVAMCVSGSPIQRYVEKLKA